MAKATVTSTRSRPSPEVKTRLTMRENATKLTLARQSRCTQGWKLEAIQLKALGITCCSSPFSSLQAISDYKGDKHATQIHKARTRPTQDWRIRLGSRFT